MRVLACATVAVAALALAGCGGSSEDSIESPTVSLTNAPAIASWSSVNGVMVPLGKTDGPKSAVWEPLTGFSHTPQGAALAAIGQSVQLSTAADQSWSKVLSVVAASGEGRDAFAVNRSLISSTGTVDPAVVPSIVGYVFADYTDVAASVDIVQRFPDESLASTRTDVIWADSDWKLNLSTPENAVAATALTELPQNMVDLEGTRK
ncbi:MULTISPECIES: hypothetical protein [unclassified Rhodococcus (in: high G+C Gram-positive bacteria)]|uniref:hypothetical protein n=1 Tax=unclassified Rhodococcus (in: high G+C Gram-positive bacteria) TaxID=192944 RepID=UPI00049760DD|nr:hypothetical protein [Rhodococcus sp. DK17]